MVAGGLVIVVHGGDSGKREKAQKSSTGGMKGFSTIKLCGRQLKKHQPDLKSNIMADRNFKLKNSSI